MGEGERLLRSRIPSSLSAPVTKASWFGTYLVMTSGIMIRMAATRSGNPGKPRFDDLMYIGLKIKAPRKLQKVSTVDTNENMAPAETNG